MEISDGGSKNPRKLDFLEVAQKAFESSLEFPGSTELDGVSHRERQD